MDPKPAENPRRSAPSTVRILPRDEVAEARTRAHDHNRTVVAGALLAVRLRRDGLELQGRVLGRHLELLELSDVGPRP